MGIKVRGFFRQVSVWMLAAFFSWATVLLASGPLRALRLSSPFWVFWPMALGVTAGLWWLVNPFSAIAFASITLVIGLFTEIEGLGANRGVAGVSSISALVAMVGLAFGSWCRANKVSPVAYLSKWVEPTLLKVKELNPALTFETDSIVAQLPSGLIILGLIALALAVLSESTWLRVLGTNKKLPLKVWTEFRVWDVALYVLMCALLAAFTHHGFKSITMVGLNLLNVMLVLYFFQGMAVIYKSFDFFGVGPVWRIVVGLVLVFQLAILVAALGVADYWLEFRNRLRRKPADAQMG